MSRAGYPRSSGRHFFGIGVYTVANGGGVFTDDKSSDVLWTYDDAVGANTIGYPHVKRDNDYYRLHFQNSSQSFDVHGSSEMGDSYSGVFPPETVVTNAGWNRRAGEGLIAMHVNYDRIVTKLITALQDRQTNAAQFIVERQQTINLVLSSARRIADAIHSVRKGNIKHAIFALTGNHGSSSSLGKALGGVPEQWLALQYGWKPLLSDIHGSCEELARLSLGEPPVLSVSASATTPFGEGDTEVSGQSATDGTLFPQITQFRKSGIVHGRGYLETKLSSTFGQNLARTGMINPYNLAWEELPYSFVVDWFLPVGNFLSLLDYETGLVFSRGYVSQKAVDTWDSKTTRSAGRDNNFGNRLTLNWSGGKIRTTVTHFKRSAFSGLPPVPPPRFKNPFSLNHVANGLSLLATAFDRPGGIFNFMK